MAVDFSSAVSAAIPTPTSTTPYAATDPDQIRKTDEARQAQMAEQRRLEEIQADQTRAETAREERARREQVSRNANGEVIGTTFSAVA